MKIRRGIWALLWIFSMLAIIGILYRTILPVRLEKTIKRYLTENLSSLLGVNISVQSVAVDVSRRQLSIYDFRADQPEGFGDSPFVFLPAIEIRISLRSILSGDLKIEQTAITNAEINIRIGTNGLSNVQFFADRLRTRHPAPDQKTSSRFRSLHIVSLTAAECTVFYFQPPDPAAVEFSVASVAVQLSNIRIEQKPAMTGRTPGRLEATGRLQKPPFPDGRCGIIADIGCISAAPPPVNCSVRLVGVELVAVAPALSREASVVLGGDAIDLSIDFRSDATFLTGQAVLETIAGYRHEAVISGTPENPLVKLSGTERDFLYTRGRGILGNLFRYTSSAGKSAVGSAAATAAGLAESAVGTAESVGKGLRGAVKGLASLDSSAIRAGIKEMGSALSEGTKDAFATAGGDIKEGAGTLTKKLTGDELDSAWRQDIPRRWTNAWLNAFNFIDHSDFPPVP